MFYASFINVLLLLFCSDGMGWYAYMIITAITAGMSAAAELYSLRDRCDNLTVSRSSIRTVLENR